MAQDRLCTILEAVRDGRLEIEEARQRLVEFAPLEALPFATLDHEREERTGFPEVVFCAGKTPDQAATIAHRLWRRSSRVLATRASAEHAEAIVAAVPGARHNALARTVLAGAQPVRHGAPIVVATAGTSDLPVAEEAAETLRAHGEPVERIADIGVAGISRVIAHRETFERASVVIVVAGMEGALPSVVGGLTSSPVVAVPTSVGYGSSFEGLSALLGMLNSCAPGISVVNIDNGFGAAVTAARIASRSAGDARTSPSGEIDEEQPCA